MKKFIVPIAITCTLIGVRIFLIHKSIQPGSNYVLFLSLLLIFGPWVVIFMLFLKTKKGDKNPE